MKTIVLTRSHDGKESLLCNSEVPLTKQREIVKGFKRNRINADVAAVRVYKLVDEVSLTSPAKAKAKSDAMAKEQKAFEASKKSK